MIGDVAHVCNRGVEKRTVFLNEKDYARFVGDLFRFNNDGPSLPVADITEYDASYQHPIVDILKWSLLPNHYHLLLLERIEGGIVKFIQRLGNGYTKYFNIKNERSGYLFQNAAKINVITKQSQFLYIPLYVELNPLDLFDKNWRTSGIKEIARTMRFLENYRWSSYRDYTGKNNFPFLLNKKLFYELFETNEKAYQKEVRNWLGEPQSLRYRGATFMHLE